MSERVSSQIRVPKELWKAFRRYSVEKEISMNQLLIDALIAYQKKFEKNQKNA